MEKTYGIIMAVIVGICLGTQPAINAVLGKSITPKIAAFHSVLTSTVIMLTIILVSGNFKEYANIKNVPPLYWIGGTFGIVIVFLSIKVVPILGAASALSIFVSLHVITGAVLSHFGLFGVTKSPIDFVRLFGIILILIGVKIVVR